MYDVMLPTMNNNSEREIEQDEERWSRATLDHTRTRKQKQQEL